MHPKRYSEYTPTTQTTGNEIVPMVKNGANTVIRLKDLPISLAMQAALDAGSAAAGQALAAHIADTNNPHAVTKAQVGLGNASNTSDANKPVSTAQQAALDTKQPLDSDLTVIAGLNPTDNDVLQRKAGAWINRTPTQFKVDLALVKADVGLGNADNTSDANKPVSSATQAALALKANLASPVFTGLPTAPTAAAGNSSTLIATTAFVRTEVQNLVDSAPGALDTLNELAAALGDDPNFAGTVTNSLALKANDNAVVHLTGNESLAGVKTFSSSPLVPSPTLAAQVANKLYVDTVLALKSQRMFNIKDYGALGDGSTDDTAAIIAAKDAAVSAGGGTVYIPVTSSFYRTKSQILWASNVNMLGEGEMSLIKPDFNGYCFFLLDVKNITFYNFKIDGFDVPTTQTSTQSIRLRNVENVKIFNSKVVNNRGGGIWITSDSTHNTTSVWIKDCFMTGFGNGDVIGGGPATSPGVWIDKVVIEGCDLEQNVDGTGSYYNAIDIVGVRHVRYVGNNFKGGVQFGSEQHPNQFGLIANNTVQRATNGSGAGLEIVANSASTLAMNNIVISGNTVEDSYIAVKGASGMKAKNILVSNNTVKSYSGANGIFLQNLVNSNIIGNTVSNATNGVYVDGCSFLVIADNTLDTCTNASNTGAASDNIKYLDNQIINCTNNHQNVDMTTSVIRVAKGNKFTYGANSTDSAGHHFYWAQNDVPGFMLSNAGTHHGQEIRQSGVLANNRNGFYVWSDAVQTTGNGMITARIGNAGSSITGVRIENLGTGSSILVSNNVGTVFSVSAAGAMVASGSIRSNADDSYFGAGNTGTGGIIHIGNLGTTDGYIEALSSAANASLYLRSKGTGTIIASNPLAMSSNKITGLGNGSAAGDAINYGQFTTAQINVARIFNVKDPAYGAVGDGVTSDSAAINAASLAASNAGGGIVWFPNSAAAYAINAALNLYSNVHFIGATYGGVTLLKVGATTGGNADIFRSTVATTSTYLDNVRIENFILDGTNQNTGGNLATLQGINGLIVRNVKLINPNQFGLAIGSVGGATPYIERLLVENIFYTCTGGTGNQDALGGGGIKNGLYRNIKIIKNNRAGTGIDLTNMDQVNFKDVFVEFINPVASNWGLSSDFGAKNVKIDGVHIKNGGQYGIYIGTNGTASPSDIKISNVTVDTVMNLGIWIQGASAARSADVKINNATVRGYASPNASQGIKVEYTDGFSINGNTVGSPGTTGQYPILISNVSNGSVKHNNFDSNISLAVLQSGTNSGVDVSQNNYAVVPGTQTDALSIRDGVVSLPLNPLAITEGGTGARTAAAARTALGVEPTVTPGTSAQYYRGDKTFQTLNTAAVPESGNLYYTTARANADFDTRIATQKGVANGIATLDGSGLIPTAQLPALAITSTSVVASQAAQLALTAQEGDVAVRTDINKSYIKTAGTAGTMADWQELLTPTDLVLSVNGQTGAVVLTTSNIAEGTNLYYTEARVSANSTVVSKAAKGANSDITSLSGLTTALSVAQGGTGAATLTGLVKGNGTAAFSAAVAGTDYISPTGTETLSNKTLTTPTIASFVNATHNHQNAVGGGQISLTAAVTGILPIANGGTGSASQNFVDLTTAQTVAGAKTFSDTALFNSDVQVANSKSFKSSSPTGTGITFFKANGGAGDIHFLPDVTSTSIGNIYFAFNSTRSFQFGAGSSKPAFITIDSDAAGYTTLRNGGVDRVYADANGVVLYGASRVSGAKLSAAAGTASYASLLIPAGVAPTTPANGDIWQDGTHIYARINGSTYQLDNTTVTTPVEVTGTTQSAAVNQRYISNNAARVVYTLPTTAAVGDQVLIRGKGAGGWRLGQNASQVIHGATDTTTGTGGYIESQTRYDVVVVECITANNEWLIVSNRGTLTVV